MRSRFSCLFLFFLSNESFFDSSSSSFCRPYTGTSLVFLISIQVRNTSVSLNMQHSENEIRRLKVHFVLGKFRRCRQKISCLFDGLRSKRIVKRNEKCGGEAKRPFAGPKSNTLMKRLNEFLDFKALMKCLNEKINTQKMHFDAGLKGRGNH